jgi:hypothetical protein
MPIQPAQNVVIAEKFRLNRLLGRGGMGSVWHATHLGLDVPCAVKFIEGEAAQLPEVQARFEREAKAAAHLRSPHVVQILDHGVCEGTPYIAMELLDGEDLGKRLARVGRLPPHELLLVVAQVSRALTKAHSQGIVHRDLKPDNIFLVRDDDREITKVLDFGIAKATGAGSSGSSTRTGAMLGTPYYMSPEQAQGTRAVDARSDLWSLAVIVFEALTGQRPFESEALGDLLMRIIVAPIPLPSHYVSDLPPAIDAWWVKASQRDPALRFQTAKELNDGLAVAFGRSGGDAVDRGPAQMGPRSAGTSAPWPGAGIAAQHVYAATPQPRFSYPETATPTVQTYGLVPEKARRRMPVLATVGAGVLVLAAGIVGVSLALRDKGSAGDVGAGTTPVFAVADAMAGDPGAAALVPLPVEPKPSAEPALAAVPDETKPSLAAARPRSAKPSAKAKPAAVSKEPPAPVAVPPTPAVSATAPTPASTADKKKPIDLGI